MSPEIFSGARLNAFVLKSAWHACLKKTKRAPVYLFGVLPPPLLSVDNQPKASFTSRMFSPWTKKRRREPFGGKRNTNTSKTALPLTKLQKKNTLKRANTLTLYQRAEQAELSQRSDGVRFFVFFHGPPWLSGVLQR